MVIVTIDNGAKRIVGKMLDYDFDRILAMDEAGELEEGLEISGESEEGNLITPADVLNAFPA